MNGKCQYGSKCWYVHDEKAKKEQDKRRAEEPKKKAPCHFFNKPGGCRRGDKCNFLHEQKPEPKPEQKPGGTTDAKPTVSVIVCGLQSQNRDGETRVLMDSGANEVVRPYNPFWWKEIIVFKNKGKPVTVKLAGGQEIQAAMTQHGEIMLPGRDDQDTAGWILPVSRITKELGIKVTWGPEGVVLTHADGRKVKARTEQGLAFLQWDDFVPIRSALIESHKKGKSTTWYSSRDQ